MGEALRCSGRLAEARQEFWSSAQDAAACVAGERSVKASEGGDADRLAVAALGLGGIWVHEHRSSLDQARVESLQRCALGHLDADSPLARRLAVRLAAEQAYLDGEATPVLAEVDLARSLDDPIFLAEALSLAHHCVLGPRDSGLRMALADELIAVSPRTGRPIDGLMGLAWRTVDLVLFGDRRAARSLTELRGQLEDHRCDGLRYLADSIDVMLAVRDGRLDDAESLAARSYELGLDVGDADALGWYGAQLISIRWLQGRAGELLPLVREIADSTTVAEPAAGFVAAVAALAAAAGDKPTARAALACLRAAGLSTVLSSSSWSATMLGVCEAAHLLGDADAAREAYGLLAPYAHLPVLASLGVASFGSAHRPLALAARTMGDLDLAVAHLEAAVLAEMAIGDAPWHAIALAALADVLDERTQPGDVERAGELRTEAIAAARRLGMDLRAAQWQQDQGLHTRLHREGRVWTVSVDGRSVVVPHCVGLHYLAQLVANPDVELDAVGLASDHTVGPAGTPIPVLDARAVAEYRHRIEELHAEVDDAEACADLERASRARIELDQFIDVLARSMGLGGTVRPFADHAERARVSVHKAIKRALRVIADADPVIGDHLHGRVVTGKRCRYLAGVPERRGRQHAADMPSSAPEARPR